MGYPCGAVPFLGDAIAAMPVEGDVTLGMSSLFISFVPFSIGPI